ncbi:hypothetical protein [Marinifilum flexuosum]|nr:hypothetical protein [Marinifilum flexuosum]
MTIDLKFKIQESLFNYYEQTKSENISTGICRTNSTISNKVSNEILNFKQLTFITGSHNTNISQLATWLCQRACLQSDHKYPIPVYIDISGKTFSDNRYCLEEQVIAQYWKIKKDVPLSVKICEVLTKSLQFKLIIDGVDTLSDEDQKYRLPRQLERINQTDCIIITRKGSRMFKQYPWVNQVSVLEKEKISFKKMTDPKLYLEELEFKYYQEPKSNNTSINNEQVDYRQREFNNIILEAEKFACILLKRRSHEFKSEKKNHNLRSLATQLHQLELGNLIEIEDTNSWKFHFVSPELEEYLISCHIKQEFTPDSIIALAFETQTLTLAIQLLQRNTKNSEFIAETLQELKKKYNKTSDVKYYYILFIFLTKTAHLGNNINKFWTEEFGQDFISTYLSSIKRKKWHYFLLESAQNIFKHINYKVKTVFIQLIIVNLKNKYQKYLQENKQDSKILTEINCLIYLIEKLQTNSIINISDSYKELIFNILHQLNNNNLSMDIQSSVFTSIFSKLFKVFKEAGFNTILELTDRLKKELLPSTSKDISTQKIVYSQQIQNLIKYLNSPEFLIHCANNTLENEIDCWFTICEPVPNDEDSALLAKHLKNLTNIFFKIASDKYLNETEKSKIISIIIKGVYTISELPKPYRDEDAIKKIFEAYQLLDMTSIDASIAFWDTIRELNISRFSKTETKELLDKLYRKRKYSFDNAFFLIACNHEIPYQFLGPYLEKIASKIVKFNANNELKIRLKNQLRRVVRNDKTGWSSIECLRKPPYNSEKEYLNNVMSVVLEESNFHSTNIWSIVKNYAGSKETYNILISILSRKIRYDDSRNILPIIQIWTNYSLLSTLESKKLDQPIYLLLKGVQLHRKKLSNEFNWDIVFKSLSKLINKVQSESNGKNPNSLLRCILLYSLSSFNEAFTPAKIDLTQFSKQDQNYIKAEIIDTYNNPDLKKMKNIFDPNLFNDLTDRSKDKYSDQWEILNEKLEIFCI